MLTSDISTKAALTQKMTDGLFKASTFDQEPSFSESNEVDRGENQKRHTLQHREAVTR